MKKPAADRYLNRETSWLAFNQRVLDRALDRSLPLLERLKFLCIVSSNLDEYYMVRVGGLRMLQDEGRPCADPSGRSCLEQLEAISREAHGMVRAQYECLYRSLLPGLKKAAIQWVSPARMNDEELRFAERFFHDEIVPIVTPVAVDPESPIPFFLPLRLQAAIRLPPAKGSKKERYAVILLPSSLERIIPLPSKQGFRFALIEDILKHFVGRFFTGETVRECVLFRVTRNADISVREDQASDLLAGMEEILKQRKRGDCVRLEIESGASEKLSAFLQKTLETDSLELFRIHGPLQLHIFQKLVSLEGFDALRLPSTPPRPQPGFDPAKPLFETLSKRSLLLHHPYESFDPVVKFVEDAARDPAVLAIKQILYRTSRESLIVKALEEAAMRGKQVTVIVELKARFDEARNMDWAKRLEEAGAQVIYGIKGLKTHAKLCIVIRREQSGLVRYLHCGTGNYNETTARLYSDISYLTTDEALGMEAAEFFNAITGGTQPSPFTRIAAAPLGLKERLITLIENETERCRQGDRKARIQAKMNSLVDPAIIEALYRASKAGVRVQLNIRGICCLRPGVKGLSENISVISIVDRFLEHARIFHFRDGGKQRLFISSADWMPRNLERRIELMVPVEDPELRARLLAILETFFRDNTLARMLLPDGRYVPVKPGRRKPFRAQTFFLESARKAEESAKKSRRTVFEPHRSSVQK